MNMIEKAKFFGIEKHKDQLDDDGEPYFWSHCWVVASAVHTITNDEDVIIAALLHDTIEDTDTTYEELEKEFGKKVADLVMEVTHEGTKDNYGYYFPRLKSKGAILIKLIDRASNISRMDSWDEERKKHFLKRTKFWKDGSDLK